MTMQDPVYPRVCGGTRGYGRGGGFPDGLSPRVRGNQVPPGEVQPGRGSIPACAGEPATAAAMPFPSTVYPRVCGGTRPRLVLGAAYGGLSPRVRGNLMQSGVRVGYGRSIPACAGEPSRQP